MKNAVLGAVLAASLVALSANGATAQSTNNIGGGGGGGGGGCVSTVLAGDTSVYICPTYYTAQSRGISCQGGVSFAGGGYNLGQGPCNAAGQFFLGGRLSCGGGAGTLNIGGGGGGQCFWQPSPAGLAQGYHPETVFVR